MRRSALSIRLGDVIFCVLASLALLASAPAVGEVAAAGGNNGTVKIHDGAAEAEPIVRNEPHVCTFHLHFLFADPGQGGSWEVREWAPAAKGAVVLAGSYDTTDDGADRQPAAGEFTLPDGHYKLLWEGRNEHNVKHKTFWVECAVGPSPNDSSPGPGESSPGPTGEELPAEGTPDLTPPPTDTVRAMSAGTALGPVLILLVGIIAGALSLGPVLVRNRR